MSMGTALTIYVEIRMLDRSDDLQLLNSSLEFHQLFGAVWESSYNINNVIVSLAMSCVSLHDA